MRWLPPAPPRMLLRGAGTFSVAVHLVGHKLSVSVSEDVAGSADDPSSNRLIHLSSDNAWLGGGGAGGHKYAQPFARRRALDAFALGAHTARVARRRERIGRVWFDSLRVDAEADTELQTALGVAAPPVAPHSRAHLLTREALRGLLTGGVAVEIELERYLESVPPSVSARRVFIDVLDPLERLGAELVWPRDELARRRCANAVVWNDRHEVLRTEVVQTQAPPRLAPPPASPTVVASTEADVEGGEADSAQSNDDEYDDDDDDDEAFDDDFDIDDFADNSAAPPDGDEEDDGDAGDSDEEGETLLEYEHGDDPVVEENDRDTGRRASRR